MAMKDGFDIQSSQELEVFVVRNFEEIESIRHIWEKMQAEEPHPKINADIDGYLTISKATGDSLEPYIIVLKESGRPVTMLIGRIDKSRLKCTIGRRVLFNPVLRQLSIVYGGVIGRRTEQIIRVLVIELMKMLRRSEVDAVYFNHLETDSFLYRIIRKEPGLLSRCYLPRIENSWRMKVPEDMDSFYRGLPRKHRNNLRRVIRKLERVYSNKVKVVTYREPGELDVALKTISDISATTYQHAYGLGVVDDQKTRTILSQAALLGWLRIDILYIDSEPAAFQLAMKYGDTYFGDKFGFNPKWKDFRIGTVLFLRITETLCGDPTVAYYDFGSGDAEYKGSYCDTHWAEGSIYIFAPRVFPVFVNLILSITSAITILTGHIVTKLGIRSSVQQYRHRRILEKKQRVK